MAVTLLWVMAYWVKSSTTNSVVQVDHNNSFKAMLVAFPMVAGRNKILMVLVAAD